MVVDCAVRANSARVGGGAYSYRSDSELVRCVFSANSAECGGGVAITEGGSLKMTDCLLSGNVADSHYNERAVQSYGAG